MDCCTQLVVVEEIAQIYSFLFLLYVSIIYLHSEKYTLNKRHTLDLTTIRHNKAFPFYTEFKNDLKEGNQKAHT